MPWHAWGAQPNGWAGFASTWDVKTYDKYAAVIEHQDVGTIVGELSTTDLR